MIRLIFLFLTLGGAVAVLAFPNEPEGFRGVLWGSPIEAMGEEMVLKQQSGDTAAYTRLGDRLQLGDVVLRDLQYIYFRGRLSAVIFSTAGIENRDGIMRAFAAQYGPGHQPNRYIRDVFWRGAVANAALMCGTGNSCTALLQSQRMRAEEETAKRSAAERAKADF